MFDNRREAFEQTVLVLATLLGFVVVVSIVFFARHLLPLIFGSILFAVVFNRVAAKLGGYLPESFPRSARLGIVFGLLLILTVGATLLFVTRASDRVAKQADRIEQLREDVIEAAKEQPLLKRFMKDKKDAKSFLPTASESFSWIKSLFSSTFGVLADTLILIMLTVYFAISPKKYRSGMVRLVPRSWRERFSELLEESSETLWRWMLGRLLAMAIVGVLFGIGLAVIGIPMPIELGILAGLLTFVPTIGAVAAVLPALILSFQDGPTSAVAVLVLYLVIQFVESYLVTPMVQQQQVSVPPAILILAQIAAGILFGFWGVMFATPFAAVVVVWIKSLYVEDYLESNKRESVATSN